MRKDLYYLMLIAPMAIFAGIFYLVPLINIGYLSVSDPTAGLDNYRLLFSSASIQKVFRTTLYICAVTTLFSVIIGYILAFAAHVSPKRMRVWITFCVLVPFWMSVLIRAFSWVTLLRSEGLINSALLAIGIIDQPLAMMNNSLGVMIGMTHYMIPYAFLPLLSNMDGVDPALVSASRGLGASPSTTFWKVFLPLTKAGIFAAVLLVFILSLGFYVTPVILGGGRTVMVAEYMTVQIQQTVRWGLASTLSIALLLTVFVLIAAVSRTMNMRRVLGGGA